MAALRNCSFVCIPFLALLSAPMARASEDPAQALADRIDELLGRVLKTKGVTPAPAADDAEYLRRVYLDLAGRIPRIDEVRDFLADKHADKRQRLVTRLLAGPAHARHASQTLRAFLVPQASANPRLQHLAVSLEAWLRPRIRAGRGYDALVREMLTAPLDYHDRPANAAGPPLVSSPIAFYQANDLKAETVASSAARLFLGIKIECAQCHDHPFAQWTRRQFWETAAFFAGVPPLEANAARPAPDDMPLSLRFRLRIPDQNTMVAARFLDGGEPDWDARPDPRRLFADWMTARNNPYFARMAANRIWAQLFGVGLVDPIDDFGPHNKPSHPELLDELARAFADNGCDERFLLRALTRTASYQRTSRADHPDQEDARLFARMNVKGLSAEQLFDSLALATGYRDPVPLAARPAFGWERDSPRGQFVAKFGGASRRTDQQASILQALALMNGKWLARQTDLAHGETLRAVADAPFLDDKGRLETLYLATLSRTPRPEELRRLGAYLERAASADERRKALADVFWTLLNSNEFLLNH
ncbi:MAG TPA: DUF1553 domain-containing protein [Gemmataceae bacterium]